MAVAVAYQTGWTGVELIQRSQDRTLTAPMYVAGVLVAPTTPGSTVTIYNDAGAVIATGPVVVVGSIATYALAAAATAGKNCSERWRVEWALLMPDGVIHTESREAMLVYRRITCPVSQIDLLRTHPELARRKDSSLASLDGWIETAWSETVAAIVGSGKMLWLNLDSTALWNTVRLAALGGVFRSLSEGGADSRDLALAGEYRHESAVAWSTVTLVQADPDTGLPTGRRASARPRQWLC